MSPEPSRKVASKIEALCEQGCTQINQLLEKAENGKNIKELSEFSSSEINQIINELGEIMSVYNDNNSLAEK